MSHPGPTSSDLSNFRTIYQLPTNPSTQDIAQLRAYVDQASRAASVPPPAPNPVASPPHPSTLSSFSLQPPFTQAPTGTSSAQTAITPYRSARLSQLDSVPPITVPSGDAQLSRPTSSALPLPSQHAQRYPALPVEIPGANNGDRILGYPPFQRPTSFLGFQGMTSQANQQRLASASTHLARRPTLPIRTQTQAQVRRASARRGAAIPPPSLPSSGEELVDCYIRDEYGRPMALKIRAKVYPPLNEHTSDYYAFRFHTNSFDAYINEQGLLHDYEFPLTTSVMEIMKKVASDMENGPFSYCFGHRQEHILAEEDLPLGLLGVLNRGRSRSNNQVYFKVQPVHNGMTLEYLTSGTPAERYAVPGICFKYSRFNLHFASEDEDEDLSMEMMPPSTRPVLRSRGLNLIGPASSRVAPRLPTRNVLARSEESFLPVPQLPAVLWANDWVPPVTSGVIDIADLEGTIFEAACGEDTDAPRLTLKGPNVAELSQQLVKHIESALEMNDFSKILSPTREFKIVYIDSDGHERLRSAGRGVEQETVYLAFNTFRKNESEFFLPRAGNYSSLAVTHSFSTSFIPRARLQTLSVLGSLAALMLVYGMAPNPLSPVFIHYMIHDCNFDSIHPGLLSEWLPELRRLLREWIDGDCTLDLAPFQEHFSTYHDIQISCLQHRDDASHHALAAEMLHKAVIGPEFITHPEFQAFLKGFRLYCANGFTFTKIKSEMDGGSEALLNFAWSSQIKSFEDLEPHLRFSAPLPPLALELQTILSPHGQSFTQLLHGFLKGSGVPCPTLFEAAKVHFSPVVDLSRIGEPNFRWAVDLYFS
ncbi:hypothetical protein NLJ89_g10477 [Agrocybe chaxingu]|uniref:HECT domain-containing protein n=1 Tax=Agrocybe chaxingu TaxID=84603 RepID=A0A9W8MSL0_9AGAR|nr:hypothetical protein NLJ89_g10477 [Agrocybe chaxingu]